MCGLSYEKETGLFFKKGKKVGSVKNTGYLEVYYEKKKWLGHRLAWYLTYGVLPSKFIDHINGDRLDNRIENLRDVSHSTNLRNQRKIRGYHRCGKRWRAQYSIGNKVFHIGMYSSETEARKAYENAISHLVD